MASYSSSGGNGGDIELDPNYSDFINHCEKENKESKKVIKENGKKAREHHRNFMRVI